MKSDTSEGLIVKDRTERYNLKGKIQNAKSRSRAKQLKCFICNK